MDAYSDPVDYALELFARRSVPRLMQDLCNLLGCERQDVTSKEEVKTRAERLREKWKYTVSRDDTYMASDHDIVVESWPRLRIPYRYITIVREFRNERITDVRTFLSSRQSVSNREVQMLYLIGHGLSEKNAGLLRDNPADDKLRRSTQWKWDLLDCEDSAGRGALPSEVTGKAKKGNLVIFSSGFLSPEWVVELLRQRDDKYGSENTIVIVIDSCYSGSWKDEISASLDKSPLQNTRVLLQTASGPDEEAYGYYFTPLFRDLQDVPLADIAEIDKADLCDSPEVLQSPQFYDSNPCGYDPNLGLPTVDVEICGSRFRFFNQPNFFRKFAHRCVSRVFSEARGIPDSDLSAFFKAFRTESIDILCFKLKKHSSGKPLAFFLIRWLQNDHTSRLFNLHLHFDRFDKMNLTQVSHVDVTRCPQSKEKYEFMEEESTKEYIRQKDKFWSDIQDSAMLSVCEKFVNEHGYTWSDPVSWNMHDGHPTNTIRSRSAVFEEWQPNIRYIQRTSEN